jgi:hypothetical protein
MYAAAGVQPEIDQRLEIREKMKTFWSENQIWFYCNELNSSVHNGHLLRLAIDRNAREFLNDVIRRWNVDLNHIDRVSGGTVLDFVDAELAKASNTPREPILLRYRDLLISHGALHSDDLANSRPK